MNNCFWFHLTSIWHVSFIVIVWQVQERERIRQEELEYLRQRYGQDNTLWVNTVMGSRRGIGDLHDGVICIVWKLKRFKRIYSTLDIWKFFQLHSAKGSSNFEIIFKYYSYCLPIIVLAFIRLPPESYLSWKLVNLCLNLYQRNSPDCTAFKVYIQASVLSKLVLFPMSSCSLHLWHRFSSATNILIIWQSHVSGIPCIRLGPN